MTGSHPAKRDIYGLRRVAPGVVEIMGYGGRGRALAWLTGVAVLIGLGVVLRESPDFLTRQLATIGYGVAWGPQTQWADGFEACQRTVNFYPGCHPDVTPWEYVLQIILPLEVASGRILLPIFLLLFVLGPWFVILFAPVRSPLRLDGHRRVCYAWHRAWPFGREQLYIAPSGARLETMTPRRYDALAGGSRSGPVQVVLGRADQPEKRRSFPVGVFLAGGRGLKPDQAWAQALMVYGHDTDAASAAVPNEFRLPWWQRFTLRRRPRMPADIESRVDAWLTKNRQPLP